LQNSHIQPGAYSRLITVELSFRGGLKQLPASDILMDACGICVAADEQQEGQQNVARLYHSVGCFIYNNLFEPFF